MLEFLVNLRMTLIFPDFPTGSGCTCILLDCWKYVNIRGIPK